MHKLVTPFFIKLFIVVNVFYCLVPIWTFIDPDSSLLTDKVYKIIDYTTFFFGLMLWIFALAVLKKYNEKGWIQIAYCTFIGWQIISFIISPILFTISPSNMGVFTIRGIVASIILVWFLIWNFKITIERISVCFKTIAFSLLMGGLIRLLLPVFTAIYRNERILEYNKLIHLLPALAFFFLFFKLLYSKDKSTLDVIVIHPL